MSDNTDGVDCSEYETYADKVQRFLEQPQCAVHRPKNYELDIVDCDVVFVQAKDVRKAVLDTPEAKERFTPNQGADYSNVIKYILRAPEKNKLQDLEKSQEYLNWLITELREELT